MGPTRRWPPCSLSWNTGRVPHWGRATGSLSKSHMSLLSHWVNISDLGIFQKFTSKNSEILAGDSCIYSYKSGSRFLRVLLIFRNCPKIRTSGWDRKKKTHGNLRALIILVASNVIYLYMGWVWMAWEWLRRNLFVGLWWPLSTLPKSSLLLETVLPQSNHSLRGFYCHCECRGNGVSTWQFSSWHYPAAWYHQKVFSGF